MPDIRETYFQNLESLYRALQPALSNPTMEGNPCGRCRECCTGAGLTAHNVTALELDHIAGRVGEDRLPTFRRFLARDGAVEVCPYFDEAAWGCGIYAHRPYSCRVFGHHRSETTALPKVCVFAGQEKIFKQADYYSAVPMAAELRDLARGYWPYQSEHFSTGTGAASFPQPEQAVGGDALDRALILMSQERLQEALLEFEASDLPSTPYVLFCLGLVFEGLERHQDACTALGVAVGEAPECGPLWFRLACNRYSCGRVEEAEQAFLRTIELKPGNALAHGLLGGLLLAEGRRKEAVEMLSLAVRLAPELESFSRLLARAKTPTSSA